MKRRRPSPARGGKGGYEPRLRIQLREQQAVEMMLMGRTQLEIARRLDISQPAVSKILRRAFERLLASNEAAVEMERARQAMRLNYLYGESMEAWNKSKEDEVRRRQRKSDGDGRSQVVAELVSENRHGDPRHLELARRVLADLRTLYGLNAPTELTVTAPPLAHLSDGVLQDAIRQAEGRRRQNEPSVTVATDDGTPSRRA